MQQEEVPGAPPVERAGPLLPAEVTKRRPCLWTARLAAAVKRPMSSTFAYSPNERLMMCTPRSMAAPSARTSAVPVSIPSSRVSPILKPTIWQPGAMPFSSGASGKWAPMMPATCVPCEPASTHSVVLAPSAATSTAKLHSVSAPLAASAASSVPYLPSTRNGASRAASPRAPRSLVSTHTRQTPDSSLYVRTSYTGPPSSYALSHASSAETLAASSAPLRPASPSAVGRGPSAALRRSSSATARCVSSCRRRRSALTRATSGRG
mmetsp:Transcript_12181/g.35989  ORF Transcript_12181/g.35989 Transcript_12181/m.35989 type:complete len:265 (-) Transcript_12181:455-1249(-)